MSDSTINKPHRDGDGGPNPASGNNPVSAKKVEANRKNAQKSTGPRTEAGKAKAAGNSYKHGFFAKNLFLTAEQVAKDRADYSAVVDGFCAHYQPVGYLESLWLEKIATLTLRSARLLAHEQKVLSCAAPFETRSVSNLARYQASVNRELTWAIKELERLQEIRKAGSNPSELSDANEDERLEEESPTGAPPAPDGEPSAGPSIGSISAPATHENCGTNPTASRTHGPAATTVQDSDGDVPQEPEPSAESPTPVMCKSGETNPRNSLADQQVEALDGDKPPY